MGLSEFPKMRSRLNVAVLGPLYFAAVNGRANSRLPVFIVFFYWVFSAWWRWVCPPKNFLKKRGGKTLPKRWKKKWCLSTNGGQQPLSLGRSTPALGDTSS